MFTTRTGRPIGFRNFRRTLDGIASRAGMPVWFTPYTLRHTAASLMAQRGVSVPVAAAIRVYIHLYPGDLGTAAAVLDALRTETAGARGAVVVQAEPTTRTSEG